MTKEPAISPDWCHSAALKPCGRPPGRGRCVEHTHVYASKVWREGGIAGAPVVKFRGKKFVRIFLEGDKKFALLTSKI